MVKNYFENFRSHFETVMNLVPHGVLCILVTSTLFEEFCLALFDVAFNKFLLKILCF